MSTGITSTPSPNDPPAATTPPPETAEQKKKKRLWDVLLTATPVLLTILATMLVGKSSAEMTLAQYFGTRAAENQAKAGAQWGYFQAKRIRGTIQKLKADLGAFDPEMALALADRLPQNLKQLNNEATEMQPDMKGELTQLDKPVEDLKKSLAATVKEAEESRAALRLFLVGEVVPGSKVEKGLKELAASSEVPAEAKTAVQKILDKKSLDGKDAKDDRDTLKKLLKVEKAPGAGTKLVKSYLTGIDFRASVQYLQKDSLPLPKDVDPKAANPFVVVNKLVEEIDPLLNEVALAIRERKPRDEFADQLKKIDRVKLAKAIEGSENRADVFDKSCDAAGDSFKALDKLLVEQKDKLRKMEQATTKLRVKLDELPRKVRRDPNPTRDNARDLVESAERLDKEVHNQCDRFVAAVSDYEVRRYDREARFNQAIAGLYEVRVFKNNFETDAALRRKDLYLYGMYAAQAGVAVATFALAVRFAGVLFAIAAVAGVLAILMLGMGMGVLAMLGVAK